ncbi:MAG TPA: hypothetical protein VGV38_21855 [Pyrinomonadaceae bacterium]|nr:hypothetical protein [Pyrinomonadaceae bacterium]
MNRLRLQALLLRLLGAVELLAFVSVVMPRSWMEAGHEWLGMGELPQGPLLMFMIRQASYAYGMHGVSMFVLARDVERFRPLVVLNGVAFLLAAPVFFLIDYTTGMPWFWTAFDTLGCGFFGAALLRLTRDESGRAERATV